MNRIIFIGRLVRDPELRFTNSGIANCNFTLAVDRQFKNQSGEKQTDFIDCVVWRQLAELVATYLAKGRRTAVEGRLEIQSYEAQDGTKRKAAKIVCDNVQFLSPRSEQARPEEFGADVGTEIFGEEMPF